MACRMGGGPKLGLDECSRDEFMSLPSLLTPWWLPIRNRGPERTPATRLGSTGVGCFLVSWERESGMDVGSKLGLDECSHDEFVFMLSSLAPWWLPIRNWGPERTPAAWFGSTKVGCFLALCVRVSGIAKMESEESLLHEFSPCT